MNDDGLPFSAAAERNRAPILEVLARVLPPRATVLEVASGTGQHAAHFGAAQPGWTWQPTEADAALLPALAARCATQANVRAPVLLDVLSQPWPVALGRYDAVYCANLLHIAPWPTCAALMNGAARHLGAGGALLLYGPFLEEEVPTSPGNRIFDADLRQRNPAWGLRHRADVVQVARDAGLDLEQRVGMPANNLVLLFRCVPALAAG
jgi:SAM-dependent methyltransferase